MYTLMRHECIGMNHENLKSIHKCEKLFFSKKKKKKKRNKTKQKTTTATTTTKTKRQQQLLDVFV